MKDIRERLLFCGGCEFAGDIPSGEHITNLGPLQRKNGTELLIASDAQARFAHAIVDKNNIEEAPDRQKVIGAIRGCRGGSCALREIGCIPVDLDAPRKRELMRYLLNSLMGVKDLGLVVDLELENESGERD